MRQTLLTKIAAVGLVLLVVVTTFLLVRHLVQQRTVEHAVEKIADVASDAVDKVAGAVESEIFDDDDEGDDDGIKGAGEFAPTVLDEGMLHPDSLAPADGPTTLSDDL